VPVPTVAVQKPQAKLSRASAVTNFQSSKVIASGVAEIIRKSTLPIARALAVAPKREALKPSASGPTVTGRAPAPSTSTPIKRSGQPQRVKAAATKSGNVAPANAQTSRRVKSSPRPIVRAPAPVPARARAQVKVDVPPPKSTPHILPSPNAAPSPSSAPRPRNGNQPSSSARVIHPQLRRNNSQK